jgi:poly-gamma-glutamate capsule biosynthesis protein CapA/YwtB (metallophosphatase superfamily)
VRKSSPTLKLFALTLGFLGLFYFLIPFGIAEATPPQPLLSLPLPKQLSIGWVGDMVPSDALYNASVFEAVKEKTQAPDIMIGNLEATFAEAHRRSKCTYIDGECYAFRGDSNFTTSLRDAGFDVINLVNNHALDYGEEGLADTEVVLRSAGIPFISLTSPTLSIEKNGQKIGILGVSSTSPTHYILDYEYIITEIEKLKQDNDIVILVFHGGSEGSAKTVVTGEYEFLGSENRGNVEKVAHTAIDAGADIVLGSGPHVLRKMEYYKDGVIVYSAGNFVGGNEKLLTRGALGVSGIFTIFVSDSTPHLLHTIDSVVLSKEGVPYLDPTEQGRLMVEELSQ